MTEAEWLACSDPTAKLEFLRGKASDRKLRLYTVACCRRVWDFFRDERSKRAVAAGELYADGQLDAASLEVSLQNASQALLEVQRTVRRSRKPERQSILAIPALICARLPAWPLQSEQVLAAVIGSVRRLSNEDMSGLLSLINEIIENPFRPVAIDPNWRTSTVVSLAHSMYDSRDFSTMPILSDALQDADCENEDILNHCRKDGQHVRGCWVVDLILGKS